ncbi:uncharacterized protein LOC114524110 isoform X2 [Dendronephthya gigantea]|nr:uncharacterized protein LOC114524110 isoform X2 [Dendronephthya gigantea]
MDVRITVALFLLGGILEAAGKCNTPMEVAVVIDASDTLSPRNIPEVKSFLKRLAATFKVAPHASHMSVILAGARVNVAIDLLKIGASVRTFSNAVDTSIKALGGDSSLDRGLSLVKDEVFTVKNGARNFLPLIVVVLTNGRQKDSGVLEDKAKELLDMNVHVSVVGVGDDISRDELKLMVRNESEYLYQVESFKDLDALAVDVGKDICNIDHLGSLAICQSTLDIGFIVDSSGSINHAGYLNIKNFMKSIAVYMGFKPGLTHIGVVLYSKKAELHTGFAKHSNVRRLFQMLWKIPHHKDVTRIDLGLHVANTELFTTKAGMRKNAKKIAILFTDGEQTTQGVTDLIPLREASNRLRERGIIVYAVGIGDSVKRKQLLDIAGDEGHVIELSSFSELQESAAKIAASTCQAADPPVINFTQSVYETSEDKKAVVSIIVTKNRVIAPITVSIHPSPVTADSSDFLAIVQNVTFQPGETQKTIAFDLVNDRRVEAEESFFVSLSSVSRAILGEPSSVNIIDDDVVLNFTQRVYTVKENERKAKVGIYVSDGAVSKPLTVRVTPQSDTADRQDFDYATKDVTFQPGETKTKFVEIGLDDDRNVEPSERFTLSLSSKSRAVLGRPSSVIIQDDDVVINFTRPSYSARESEEKVKIGVLVTNGYVSDVVTIRIIPLITRLDSASTDDFDDTVQDVTFQPGESGPKFVEIGLVNDNDDEPTERFTVSLSSNSRAILGEPTSVNIQDDDVPPPPVISFTQPAYNASESGNAVVGIFVEREKITEPVTVRITPGSDTADGNDFDRTVKEITFQPGETGPKPVEIILFNDNDDEPTERFTVSLSSNSRAILGKPSFVYIEDDDVPPPPVISFTQPAYNASESGNAVVGIFVEREKITEPVTVRITPGSDTADGNDFDRTVKEITFRPGETGPKPVEIILFNDNDDEPTERFTVSLSSNSRAFLGEPSFVYIEDDDVPPPPVISFTQPAYNASESGNAVVGIFVEKEKITEPVTVRITPRSDTAGGNDFDRTVKEITFQPGETGPKPVEIDLFNDNDDEPTERFTVSLSSNSRAILGKPSFVYIEDDDVPPPPVISFTQPAYNASESGNAVVGIFVEREKITEPVTVRITPGSDTAGENDFDRTVKEITFRPGETGPKPVEIILFNDNDDEPTERFTVSLSSNSRAILGEPSFVYIEDDDVPPPPVISFTQPVYNASESGNAVVGIFVEKEKITEPVTVRIIPGSDTAGGNDFDRTVKEITFRPGETGPKPVEIILFNDDDDEPTERFTVSLSSNSRAILGEPSFVYIEDDDVPPPPVISFTQPAYNASESGNAVVGIFVEKEKITEPVTVRITPESDTAGGNDFDRTVKEIIFRPGETGPKPVEIDLFNDNDDEPTERFTVSLSSNSRAILGEPSFVYIEDDDVAPICGTPRDDCHKHALCTDVSPGEYKCVCNPGYAGDGKFCEVIGFRFTKKVYDVKEYQKVVVGVELASGEISEPVTVEIKTIQGTADDSDFSPVTTYVTFEPDEKVKSKTIVIDLIDDDVEEPTEEFTVRLSSPMHVAVSQPSRVRIEDDDDAEICDMDVGFLLDSTASMRNCNYEKEKDFVIKLAGYFQVASGATHTSTIVYGTESLLVKRFNETTSQKDFQKIINNLPFKGGKANLDKAMHLAATEMFSAKNGMRQNVPKVLVVLNDGARKVITPFAQEISSMLSKHEVRVVVIGVGEAEKDLLSQIVTSPEDLIMVEKFENATTMLVALLKRICLKRDSSTCHVLRKKVADLKIGGCVSEKPVEIGVCGGHCSSFSNFVKRDGVYEMNCGCCKANTKVTVIVDLKCSMNTYQPFHIRSAKSCTCESCESDD